MSNPPITTRTGDAGYTDLLDERGLPKYDLRVEVNGCVDEANAFLGLVRARSQNVCIRESVFELQSNLYLLMADVAGSGHKRISTATVDWVERLSESIKDETKIPRGFVTPGATEVGALLDIARTVLRRAERRAALLHHTGQIDDDALRFLNRASDYLFVLARWEEGYEGELPDRPFGKVLSTGGVQ